jgi:hypothetical protein
MLIGNVSEASTPFAMTSGTGAFTLASRQSTIVAVQFQPTSPGPFSSSLTITCSDPQHPSVGVLLVGTGAPGRLLIPHRLAFPKIVAGTSFVKLLSVRNSGLGVLHGNINAVLGLSEPFAVIAGGAFTLGHNQSTPVTITFNPMTPGVYSGTLGVTSDDPAHSSTAVVLTGSAK